jgi:hypothetical protein
MIRHLELQQHTNMPPYFSISLLSLTTKKIGHERENIHKPLSIEVCLVSKNGCNSLWLGDFQETICKHRT